MLPPCIDGILGLDVLREYDVMLQFTACSAMLRKRALGDPFEALCILSMEKKEKLSQIFAAEEDPFE